MATEQAVRELIALAYEAGAEPARWPAFLAALAGEVCDRSCMLQVHDVANPSGSLIASVGVDPAFAAAYDEHFAALNPWTQRAGDRMVPGAVLTGEMMISRAELRGTEFYADFLRPQGVIDSVAAVVERRDNMVAFLSATTSARAAWSSEDVALVELLLPHVRRALAMHRRIGAQRREHEALVETADRLPWGIAFVDARGKLCFANAWLRRLAQPVMTRLLAAADRGGGLLTRDAGGPLAVTIAPLRAADDGLLPAGPVRAVFVVDPDEERGGPELVLRRGYGLTAAETRVAIALAAGESLEDIAERTGTRIATLRTHLKRVFAKTGTRRQTELVRLVLLLSPA